VLERNSHAVLLIEPLPSIPDSSPPSSDFLWQSGMLVLDGVCKLEAKEVKVVLF
jgi:hypothetical protein